MTDARSDDAPEYSRAASSRQAGGGSSSTGRLRAAYFAFAALWGFVAGVGALAAGFHFAGHPVKLGGAVVGAAIPGAVFAALGGLVAAGAYREARNRRRR
ncbi:MAG TPA: hypothetical protein VF139_06150 [Candidatus Polarisedimenticolaceae bacterium]